MAPGELTIRPIVESDTAQICQVWREGLAQTYEHLEGEKRQLLENYFKDDADRATGPGGDLADPVAYWLRGGRGTFLVAMDSTGAVLGCAAVKAGTEMAWGPEEASGCDTASVWRMSVAANARRRGLGRKLMQAVEEWAAAHGYRTVQMVTGNPQAGAFYTSLGYVPFKEVPFAKFYCKSVGGCAAGAGS